jgi:hypothetical protein
METFSVFRKKMNDDTFSRFSAITLQRFQKKRKSSMVKIQVIIGSTRQNRFSEKPAHYIFDELKKREDVEAELVDLRDWPLPFYMSRFRPLQTKEIT